MTDLLKFLLEINLLIVILSAVYFAIKNRLSFLIRRRLIISIPLLAISVMLIHNMLVYMNPGDMIAVIELDLINLNSMLTTKSSLELSWQIFYYIGILIFLLRFIVKLLRVLYFFKKATKVDSGVKLLSSANKDSFSFFNYIHLSTNLDAVEKQVVLDHELVHVHQKHTLDIVIMEFYHALLWFNPLLLLLKKEMVYVHEYEVDERMYGKYSDEYIKYLLSQSLGTHSTQLLLTSQFYNGLSLTKRTKQMKNKTKNRNLLLLLMPVLAIALTFISWTNVVDSNDQFDQDKEKLYEKVDIQPKFKGGQDAMVKYMVENVKYPEECKKQNIQGTVYVGFIVRKTGAIDEAKILRSVNSYIDAEALRVIKSMPNWIPGEDKGKKVDVKYTIPINFKL